MQDISSLTITDILSLLGKKELSALELTDAYLARIEERNPALNAFLEVFEDVREEARRTDARRANGERGALLGVPLAMKDVILIKGKRVSAASKMLENYRATYDATATRKLKNAGALFLGRTNMDEFAMGGSNENSAFGPVCNPFDTTRVPGGSSGGSAAAVAGGLAPAALGSDTGGSIREPAAFCGLVGLKPTYGSVSRSGLIAMGSSLDVIGPITKTVADAKLLFEVLRGHDSLDSTSLPDTYTNTIHTNTPYRLGVPRAFLEKGLDNDMLARFNETLSMLEKRGVEIRDVSLPTIPYSLAVYYVLMPAEASTNLARFDGIRYGLHKEGSDRADDVALSRAEGFGQEVRRRILLGTYVLSSGYYDAYYGKATTARRMIADEFTRVFEEVDAIATPTAPCPAFKIGEKADPLSMYLADIFTVPANIAGIPALSVPMGTLEREGKMLPAGFQLMAPRLREDTLFSLGSLVERLS